MVLKYLVSELSKATFIQLGRTGENLATQLRIDAAEWMEECPDGTLRLLVRNPNGDLYAAPTRTENGVLIWDVSDGDTLYSGAGEIELNLHGTDGKRIKSARCSTWLDASLSGEAGEQPEAAQEWITRLLGAADTAANAAKKIDNMTVSAVSGESAAASISEKNGAKHIAFVLPKGDKGDPGNTPYIGSNGNWFVGSEDTGTKAQGPAGQNGTGSGTVTAVMVNGTKYEPDGTGNVDIGDLTGGADLSSDVPKPLGAASAGASEQAARADHIHQKPTASEVGALAVGGTAADSSKLGGKTWAERLLDIYPIGSIYMSTTSTSPASLFGGTWEQLQDRFLLGAGSTYSAGSAGGEATHTLTKSEMPSHYHELKNICWGGDAGASVTSDGDYLVYDGNSVSPPSGQYIGSTGGGSAHNNMPPYLAVYMWKRVS